MRQHTKTYPPACVEGRSPYPGLGGLTDRPAWITSWTDQASGLLDRILVRGEYRKVDCCDICYR